jgi:hypothetical protein
MGEAATATKTKIAADDLIVNTVQEVEGYDKDAAYNAAATLEEGVEFSYFKLGGILNRINEEGWYADEGYAKFSDFVEDRFGVKRSKAMHLIKIYNDLIESGVMWSDVSAIGWSKLKEISSVITKKNVKGWVKKAAGATVIQLAEMVREAKSESSGSTEDAEPGESPKISSMTFKVHDDQKEVVNEAIKKAKAETGNEHANQALEAICLDYLSGPSKPVLETSEDEPEQAEKAAPEKPTLEGLKEYMSNFTHLQVLEVFEQLFPDVDITVHED